MDVMVTGMKKTILVSVSLYRVAA